MSDRLSLVKQFYEAFSKQTDRDFVDKLLAPSFTFSAPPDPLLDRDGFFQRCWPEGGNLKNIGYIRLIENGDEIVVTHDYTKPDGVKACNTDIFIFEGDRITRLEVY